MRTASYRRRGYLRWLAMLLRAASPRPRCRRRRWRNETIPFPHLLPPRSAGRPTLRIGAIRRPGMATDRSSPTPPIPSPATPKRRGPAPNRRNVSAMRRIRRSSRGQARCYPGGVPGQLLYPFEPVYFIQTAKEVWMMWQRDHMVRRVFLTDQHSEHVTPSWFGESIGHYENGNTLVVDTIGLSTKNSYIDNFRTPHTEKLHVVERLTIDPDGKNMTAIVTVEDPDTFNGPLTMQ